MSARDIYDLRSYEPTDAVPVLEGHVLPSIWRSEDPLVESHGCHGELRELPAFEVTAIGWRDNPMCVVVDSEVNTDDPSDLLWTMTTWGTGGQDVFTVPRAQGHEMNPANDSKGIVTKIGIDATFDRGRRPRGQRVSYPMVELARYSNY
ncbi:MAG: UbiD family decarboxylase [Anaerolineae bacterium]|nr:UbiD family decarboxylase [Thermoflexales bacterium]MDW8396737.1 UbiD family decarboxylase [Anaerolineae bacterium]